ncbi:MAG: hypothetical protein QM500_12295 [Methylococcales bacterium]
MKISAAEGRHLDRSAASELMLGAEQDNAQSFKVEYNQQFAVIEAVNSHEKLGAWQAEHIIAIAEKLNDQIGDKVIAEDKIDPFVNNIINNQIDFDAYNDQLSSSDDFKVGDVIKQKGPG